MQFFGWHSSKWNIYSLYFFKTYAIFLHWDRQLSWWYYIFEWDKQFWFTEIGNFSDNLIFSIKWQVFYNFFFYTWTRYTIFIGWIFCIFWVPYEKTDSTNWCSRLSLARTNKNPKIDFCKNDAMVMINRCSCKTEYHTELSPTLWKI